MRLSVFIVFISNSTADSWDSPAVGWSDIVSGECDVLEAGLERS